MLQYMLVVLLYTITYCMASDIKTDTSVNKLTAAVQELLPNTNENLTPAQQIIYIFGPRQLRIPESSNLKEKAGSDYFITPGIGAHKLHTRFLSWNKARKVCIAEGGHLAVINSIAEEKALLRIMDENKINVAWLGIHDFYEEGDWTAMMDESLDATGYSKWRAGEPNNVNQKEHCGAIQNPDGMDDRDCTAQMPFLCEIAL